MKLRTTKQELEAKLKPSAGAPRSKAKGKLERKSYGDGTERLKISLRNLDAPDGAQAVVSADGDEIARIAIAKGAARHDMELRDPSALPALSPGGTIRVAVDGTTVLEGELDID